MKLIIAFLILSQSAFAQNFMGSNDNPAPFYVEKDLKSSDSIDWRDYKGVNWIGPVKNQANCGSCVAFASIATIEDQYTIFTGTIWNRQSFSQEALFTCGKGRCSSGWTTESAARTIETQGVVDLACAPYTAGALGKLNVCKSFCESQEKRTLHIKSIYRPTIGGAGTAADVKAALKKGPLVTTMSVRSGFDSYTGGIFKASIDDKFLGGHAVEIIGFNDVGRYWIIKNSWGPDWGEKGFARISYDDVSGVGNDTYGFEFSNKVKEGFRTPSEDQYVKGNIEISGFFTQDVQLKKSTDELVKEIKCTDKCSIDSRLLTDGNYRLETMAADGRVMTRGIVIANGSYSWVSTVSPPPSFNFSYPQSDRVYVDVTYPKSVVYPEQIILDIQNAKSQLVYRRVYNDVLDFNRLGFNSYVLPNGKYTISIHEMMNGSEKIIKKLSVELKN